MTAYIKTSNTYDFGEINIEIRSVNHKFLDVDLYLPEHFRTLELNLRKLINRFVKRGKLHIQVKAKYLNTSPFQLTCNTKLLEQIAQIKHTHNLPNVSGDFLLAYPGVLISQTENLDSYFSQIEKQFIHTLEQLATQRLTEGNELKKLLNLQIKYLENIYESILPLVKQQQQHQTDKLKNLIAEFQTPEMVSERFYQEVIFQLNRIDIQEELDRLKIHLAEFKKNLEQASGKKLDFLAQEMNREVNTINSKSTLIEIKQLIIDAKTHIEQIREQVQNIQ